MSENSDLAELYKEEFAKEKAHKEADIDRIEKVHARFDYFADKGQMSNKIKDPRFDLPGDIPDSEDEAWTTDFDGEVDAQDIELYKMYRLMQLRQKDDKKHLKALETEYRDGLKAQATGVAS